MQKLFMDELFPEQEFELELSGHKIRRRGDMFCLTDMWKAAGSPKNQRPVDWLKILGTQKYLAHLEEKLLATGHIKKQESTKKAEVGNNHFGKSESKASFLVKNCRGGKDHGGSTYAHYFLALSYAQYLSPELHTQVSTIFMRWYGADVTLIDDIYNRATKDDREWLAKRIQGKQIRAEYTATLQRHGVNGDGFGICTNKIYEGLFNKTAKQIAEAQKQEIMQSQQKKLVKATSVRDRMTTQEIGQVDFAERLASHWIDCENSQGTSECANESFLAAQEVSALWKRKEKRIS